jgi:iron complex outermembrane recepter protein
MNREFSYDVSIYDIEWKNLQTQILAPCNCTSLFTNAGDARSKGAELSTQWQPLSATLIGTSIALNDAVLTQPFPAASLITAYPGERLPYSSRFTGNISVEQTFPLAGSLAGVAGGTLSYVGSRENLFTFAGSGQMRGQLPAYAEANLHVGLKRGSWQVNLYANNVADRRGVLNDNSVPGFPFVQYIVPRTVGLSIWTTF